MSEQQPDDLVTALAEMIDGAFGDAYNEATDAAQAILRSGLVVSTAAVRALLADKRVDVTAADVIPKQAVLDLHLSSVVAGDFCTECGHAWPCATARLVVGGES